MIAPIAAQIAGKRLAVVTEGALQYVPFAALLDGAGAPLIRSHEIVSLPSASTLLALRRDAVGRTPPTKSVFVVGDPVFDRRDSRVKGGGHQVGCRAQRHPGAVRQRVWTRTCNGCGSAARKPMLLQPSPEVPAYRSYSTLMRVWSG